MWGTLSLLQRLSKNNLKRFLSKNKIPINAFPFKDLAK